MEHFWTPRRNKGISIWMKNTARRRRIDSDDIIIAVKPGIILAPCDWPIVQSNLAHILIVSSEATGFFPYIMFTIYVYNEKYFLFVLFFIYNNIIY